MPPSKNIALLLAVCLLVYSGASSAEEPAARVEHLAFEGVSQIDEDELADALLTRGPSWKPWADDPVFDEASLDEDLERVEGFYRARGYYSTRAAAEVDWNEARDAVRIRIRVDEGEPTRLVALEVELVHPERLTQEQWNAIRQGIGLEIGQVLGVRDYRAARTRLLEGLAAVGHPAPSLEGGADVDPERRTAALRWVVDPGPRVRFGAVRVEGLDRVEEEVVTRELAFERGEPYALEPQETTQDALFDLGLFRSVRITPDPPAEAEPDDGELEWPMVVTVEERKPRTLRIGVGYGTEERFRVRVEWRHRNFLGDARLLDVRAQYNALVSGLNARVTQPHFLLHDTRLEVEGYVRYETVPAYDALRASPGFMLYHDLDERWTLRTGYLFEFADVLEAHDVSELEGDTRIGTLRTGLRRSTLDDELEPTRGTWLDLSLEPSLRVLGSEESWLTLGGEVRGFLPLGIAVLALRLRAGVIDPIAGSDRIDVPVFKRFYSGGSTSVRGFPYQELGPEDASGDPLGGLSIAEGSFEVRFPLFWRLRGVGFVDAGLLDLAPYTLPLHDLRYSAGPGLRLQTAVGSIRLDVGFPLDREPGEDRFRIHLAVGHAF